MWHLVRKVSGRLRKGTLSTMLGHYGLPPIASYQVAPTVCSHALVLILWVGRVARRVKCLPLRPNKVIPPRPQPRTTQFRVRCTKIRSRLVTSRKSHCIYVYSGEALQFTFKRVKERKFTSYVPRSPWQRLPALLRLQYPRYFGFSHLPKQVVPIWKAGTLEFQHDRPLLPCVVLYSVRNMILQYFKSN